MSDVSVVIPVLRANELLRNCLASLAACRPAPLETIVVFDGSEPDRSIESLGARVVELPEWGGPSKTRNTGARRARGDIVLFLDADLTVPPDLLARVSAAFAAEPRPAAVFGSYDADPGAPNFLSQYKNLFHHYVHQSSAEEASTFFSACGAIRREVFLAVGGFDEARIWMEDIELGYRLRAHGHRIRLDKNLTVTHHKVWRAGSMLRSDILHRALPWAALMRERRALSGELNLDGRSRLSGVAIAGLLGVLVLGWWVPGLLLAVPALVLILVALNWPLYRFFCRRRGLAFALAALPWHWLYLVYGGGAFVVGTLFYKLPWETAFSGSLRG